MTKLSKAAVEKLILLRHGTPASSLSPINIVQAAKADLQAREINRELKRLRSTLPRKHVGPNRRFTFLPEHRANAKTTAEILAAAIAAPGRGMASSNISTARVYADLDLLKAAHDLAVSEAA